MPLENVIVLALIVGAVAAFAVVALWLTQTSGGRPSGPANPAA